MPYQSFIPRGPDILSQSQDDLLQNYQAIDPFIQSDHYSFNEAFPGLHKQFTFEQLVPGPVRPLTVSYGLFYSSLTTLNTPTCLFAQRPMTLNNVPYTLLVNGQTRTTNFFMLGYNIGMLTFPVQVNTAAAQPQFFQMPNPIVVPHVIPGYQDLTAWPQFTGTFYYGLTVGNNAIFLNDSNVYSYVPAQGSLVEVAIESYLRTPGGFNQTATVYVTVIGTIS